jgi:thioredoxin 1
MTMRMRLLVTREDAQSRVALAAALSQPGRERWKAQCLDVAERRHEGKCGDGEASESEERRGSSARAAAAQCSDRDRPRRERAEDAADPASDRLVEVVDEQPEQDSRGRSQNDAGQSSERRGVQQASEQDADAGRESGRDADPIEVAEHSISVGTEVTVAVSSLPERGKFTVVSDRAQPLLVFFCSVQSGPARRMESLLAHVARKERDRVRVMRVDVDERPELAERFKVDVVPTLALVKDKRIVDRLEGRASAPAIERMLAPHLGGQTIAA